MTGGRLPGLGDSPLPASSRAWSGTLDAFDARSRAWDEYTSTPLGRLRQELTTHHLVQHLAAPAGSLVVLDVGGGTGSYAFPLAQLGHRVCLLDFSAQMLAIARQKARQLGPLLGERIDFCHASVDEIPGLFSPGHFDLVLCHTLLEYVLDPRETLDVLSTVLRPGGLLSLLFANPHADPLRWAIANEDRITGGPDGMPVPALTILGFAVRGERTWYWVAGAALLVAVWLALNLIESPRGRALRALHTSEVGAEVVGIDAARQKVMVFVVSAVFAAFAGGLTAFYSGFITPAKASFMHSVELVTMVVFGGMASTFGAVVGATVLTVLPQVLTVVQDYEMVVLGAVMMATMIFFPRGVVPTLGALLGRGRR